LTLFDNHEFAGGLSEDLYRQIVTAACEAATLAAMRAVQPQISSSARSFPPDHASSRGDPVNQPNSDGNESGTNNLEPFERMCPTIPTVVWSGHITLQLPMPSRGYLMLTRTNLWMYASVGQFAV